MNTYKPGDYIVTSDGARGYIIERLDGYQEDTYQIRLVSGYAIRPEKELQHDHLMEEV